MVPHSRHSERLRTPHIAWAKPSKPQYYAWTFRPATGEVVIKDHWSDHPAFAQYHPEVASELNEGGLYHGYAYRIRGGWRITDWEHSPVTDPFVVQNILKAIPEELSGPLPSGGVEPQSEAQSEWVDEPGMNTGIPEEPALDQPV